MPSYDVSGPIHLDVTAGSGFVDIVARLLCATFAPVIPEAERSEAIRDLPRKEAAGKQVPFPGTT